MVGDLKLFHISLTASALHLTPNVCGDLLRALDQAEDVKIHSYCKDLCF